MVYVLVVVLAQAKELHDIALLGWSGPFLDGLDQAGVHLDTVFGENMTQKLSLLLHKRALG